VFLESASSAKWICSYIILWYAQLNIVFWRRAGRCGSRLGSDDCIHKWHMRAVFLRFPNEVVAGVFGWSVCNTSCCITVSRIRSSFWLQKLEIVESRGEDDMDYTVILWRGLSGWVTGSSWSGGCSMEFSLIRWCLCILLRKRRITKLSNY